MSEAGQLQVSQQREKFPLPTKGKVFTYLLTSAQNNTNVNLQVWNNLLAIAKAKNARIMVASFTYNKSQALAKHAKRKTAKESDNAKTEWWAPEVMPYLEDRSIGLAPHLVWCGELQILPTAARPLSGMESYTGRHSAIIPHTKFAVSTVPSPKSSGTKFNYTTGTVTQRNYIQKKAGQKAEFHHGYGALIVEVDSEGTWFVRQLNANNDGVIYDLDMKADASKITFGHRPKAIVWGDIHEHHLDDWMDGLCWGPKGILDTLNPEIQVLHDVLDFRSQNHHDRDDSWKVFAKHCEGGLNIEDEIYSVMKWLLRVSRDTPACVTRSNHDEAFDRWLKEADFRADPLNAGLFLATNLAAYVHIANQKNTPFNPIEWVMREKLQGDRQGRMDNVRFLHMDEELLVGGIELGMHGHVGANGGRGSQAAFSKIGRKSITGHLHSPWQHEGAMGVGVTGSLDQGYNKGMSSWSHTNALVYPNGKRTLFTVYDKKWRAQ